VDWDQSRQQQGKIYKFTGNGKNWDPDVSRENGNYDFLLGADLDFEHPEVKAEIKRWGTWFTEFTGIDGYRLDAVKHMSAGYTREWLSAMRDSTDDRSLFAIAEYLDYDVEKLLSYLQTQISSGQQLALFDMPLHLNFFRAGQSNGDYPMNQIFNNTLVQRKPSHALSFVESHDTQPLQALESPVADWFKPLAYAIILLREEGYPSVFYADYYGARYRDRRDGQEREGAILAQKPAIDQLLYARQKFAHGKQHSYFDDLDVVGWTREGSREFPQGLAVIMSDKNAGKKRMFVGPQHAGLCFRDITNRQSGCARIDSQGYGEFSTSGRSYSLWVGELPLQEN
jgi:glycosidase